MRSKKGNKEVFNERHSLNELAAIVDQTHRNLASIINNSLIVLFWQIGKAFNQHSANTVKAGNNQSVTRLICPELIKRYGSLLKEPNLKKMMKFAALFPDLKMVELLAALLSWEHASLLLKIDDKESWLFYIRLVAEQELSANKLRKQIASKLLKSKKVFDEKKRNDALVAQDQYFKKELALILLARPNNNSSLMAGIFREPLFSSFRLLTEVFKKNGAATRSEVVPDFDEALLAVIIEHIEKYSNEQNRWLNANLNMAFLKIGKQINHKTMLSQETGNQKAIIREASVALQDQYGKDFFSKKQLSEMAAFAGQIDNNRIALRIANLVSWKHVLVLIHLQDVQAILFYARLTATQGLSVPNLRKQIANKTFEKTSGAGKHEQITIEDLQNPDTKTDVKKSKNSEVTVVTSYINFDDSEIRNQYALNVFKNKYFISFAKLI